MRHVNRLPRAAVLRRGRRGVAVLVVVLLSWSCTTEQQSRGEGASERRARVSSPAPRDEPDAARVPEVPAANPAALADQLTAAAETLRDPVAPKSDQRQAGQFQQLAVRALASEPEVIRRAVVNRLDAETALVTRAGVTAARVLLGLTTPQRSLPSWRIVAPPPPTRLLGHYRLAQRRIGVHWSYLAAIHLVETRMGRIRGTSTAGARGPMQFLPATWDLYGAGGDINDPRDAILAAARLLDANGAPGDMADALWHYNPSDSYVRAVSAYARAVRRSPSAYLGYWHWRVLYRHTRGTYALPVGYPDVRPSLLPERPPGAVNTPKQGE
jgi:Transglycosylase SLT domain